jgi:hypothetical protein
MKHAMKHADATTDTTTIPWYKQGMTYVGTHFVAIAVTAIVTYMLTKKYGMK